jgi:hypothetical protein
MDSEKAEKIYLYSPISLEVFKAVLGIDDREDKLARFRLVTGTFNIEQYCKRRILWKKHFEQIEYNGKMLLPLRKYPIVKVLVAYIVSRKHEKMSNEKLQGNVVGQ